MDDFDSGYSVGIGGLTLVCAILYGVFLAICFLAGVGR